MGTGSAESKSAVAEMERPQTIAPGEIEEQRFSNDLPDPNHDMLGTADAVAAHSGSKASDQIDEEDSQSEIPGDPRAPHEMQPPTATEY